MESRTDGRRLVYRIAISIDQYRVYCGSRIVNSTGVVAIVFTDSEFKSKFGRSFDFNKDYFGVMNGDTTAAGVCFTSSYSPSSGSLYANIPTGNKSGNVRINWIVVLNSAS